MTSVILFLLNYLFVANIHAMHSSRALEGYPNGYLPDCPGSTKPAIISQKSLHKLFFTIQGPGDIFRARRIRYNYYLMHLLAKDPDMDFKKKTLLYVGGYIDSSGYPSYHIMAKHYKDLGYNVIMLDMIAFSSSVFPVASRFMRPVGLHAAEMLANLTSYGLDPKKLELAGISLGGQTISFIAKNYRLLTGMNISRLTGLDPSGPCFRNLGPEDRLDDSDADFVDVLHTNIEGMGMAAPIGHVNFYANGGEFQAAELAFYPCNVMCSHLRVYLLWLYALRNPTSFIGIKCNSVQQARDKDCFENEPRVTNLLGPNVDRTKPGIYYLATTNQAPFYMGKKGLIRENDPQFDVLSSYNKDDIMTI